MKIQCGSSFGREGDVRKLCSIRVASQSETLLNFEIIGKYHDTREWASWFLALPDGTGSMEGTESSPSGVGNSRSLYDPGLN